MASKFFEHFIRIAEAMNDLGPDSRALWDDNDGFYYDALLTPDGAQHFLKVRSLVGVDTVVRGAHFGTGDARPASGIQAADGVVPQVCAGCSRHVDTSQRSLLGVHLHVTRQPQAVARVLDFHMLDQKSSCLPLESVRAFQFHQDHPYVLCSSGVEYRGYEPTESRTGTFSGNSNWRGPVWFPSNFLLIEALQRFHYHFGDDFA